MAKVTVPTINIDDEITSTDINTFISSVNALPGNVNDDNVREQGIDRRNIEENCATYTDTTDRYLYKSDTDHLIPTNVSSTGTMTDGSSFYPIGVGTGASGLITLSAGERMIVWASFEYHVVLDASYVRDRNAGDGGYEVWFHFGSRNTSSGSYTLIASTLRKSNIVLADRQDESSGAHIGNHFTPKASLTICTVIDGPVSGTQDWQVALLGLAGRSIATTITIDARIKNIQMFAKVVKR